jgi:hypothetical protein
MSYWFIIKSALRRAQNTGTKYLRDDGTWSTPAGGSLPSLTGNVGKVLTVSVGEAATEWATVSGGSGLTHPQVLARGLGA